MAVLAAGRGHEGVVAAVLEAVVHAPQDEVSAAVVFLHIPLRRAPGQRCGQGIPPKGVGYEPQPHNQQHCHADGGDLL